MIDPVTGEIIDEQQLAEQLLKQAKEQGVDEIVLPLIARGLTTGEVAAHFDDVYGASASKDTISRITDKVIEEMTEWQIRPLHRVYPVVFIDALVVKVRDVQVRNKPFYLAVGVTVNGERDILGIWAGDGGEGAKSWFGVLTEIKNRGAEDVCIVVCHCLKGLPESINTAWPLATVQTCIIDVIRNTFRFASRHDGEEMGKNLRPVYTAPTEAAARERFVKFDAKWDGQYPAIITLWRSVWSEFVPFLDWGRRDPPDHLQHGRDRVPQCPISPRRPSSRPLPERRRGVEVSLPRDSLA